MKEALTNAPVLRLPDFSQPFVIETDASTVGMGAVLMQEGRPIAYLSKVFSIRKRGLSVYEKKLLALVLAVESGAIISLAITLSSKTDHQSLKFLLEQKLHNSLQYKWLSKLLGLDYEIHYKKGVENKVADGLSRRTEAESSGVHLAVLTGCPSRPRLTSAVQPEWVQQIELSYATDATCQQIITQLLLDPTSQPEYQYVNGILKKNNRIVVGSFMKIRRQLIEAMHTSPLGGHSGQNACYHRMKLLFSWPLLKQDMIQVIRNCVTCQKNKDEHVKSSGLLQPLPIPQQAWKQISMDFIEKLPVSDRADTILVVVDRFTKYANFITLSHPFTAVSVAQLFLEHIFRLHGLPDAIVSDRDKLFLSHFFLAGAVQSSRHFSALEHGLSSPKRRPDSACESMPRDLFALFCL